MSTPFVYRKEKTRSISFPLGGLGTGSIGLAGNGQLVDWDIYNKPNKGSLNGSHFIIKAEKEGKLLDARVLHGDLAPPYSGSLNQPAFMSFGFGPTNETMAGFPHFREVVFNGEFPVARLEFLDEGFPGKVSLTAFNPFIPLNEDDSGIPAAFFEYEIHNPTADPLDYVLAGTLRNPQPAPNINRYQKDGAIHCLFLTSDKLHENAIGYGNLALATDAQEIRYQEYAYRGSWFDTLEIYWQDFTALGGLQNRTYAPAEAGERNLGILAARVRVAPGESKKIRFVIAWHYPNCENYWSAESCQRANQIGAPTTWKNYYATRFHDSRASAAYALNTWDRLYRETLLFKNALYGSTLPGSAMDAVAANLSVLKSPTVFRLEDGTLYGFEGCHAGSGCCEGSCTHVWNYTQSLAFLFPRLERSMREADYRYNQRSDGGMRFRMILPLELDAEKWWNFRACADGQFGGVMRIYREWKISGDTGWLRTIWQGVKKSVEFAWAPTNEDRWDPERSGVLTGRQHHTLDMELFSPNAWLTGFYLGALKAGAEMADGVEDQEAAGLFLSIFEKGKRFLNENLYNGEYFAQMIDLKDRSILEKYDAVKTYWDEEHGEMKYQVAGGCILDQVLAQWHATIYGLGDIFDPDKVKTALKSIYRNNFKDPMRNFPNPCRLFSLNDEAGLVICDYPEGSQKPRIPIPYAQETMTGFEYAAAIQMIQVGLVEEGTRVVEAIRDRYDGEKRNPWNEIECGSNYARSMASYALLNAFSGFQFDMVNGRIGFSPANLLQSPAETWSCFWSLDSGWGVVWIEAGEVRLEIKAGSLAIRHFHLPFLKKPVQTVEVNDREVLYHYRDQMIVFEQSLNLQAGEVLKVVSG